jgi:hypothetical protein
VKAYQGLFVFPPEQFELWLNHLLPLLPAVSYILWSENRKAIIYLSSVAVRRNDRPR